jgi:hypothetical protein
MKQMTDDDEPEDDHHRQAVAAAVQRHIEIQALAAERTAAAGLRMVLSRRARQRASMKPYLLAVGTRCRISFLYSPTVRMHVKTAIVNSYAPTYTPDLYVITARGLAPGSKRVVLYDLSTVEPLEAGSQAPTRMGTLLVRLPTTLTACDRRWLMPMATDATPSFASRFPQATIAFSLMPPGLNNDAARRSGEDLEVSDAYDDLRSEAS